MRGLAALWFCLLGGQLFGATPLYVVGGIPTQSARQNETLWFQLQPSHPGAASFSYSLEPGYPAPQGALSLSGAGLFSYTPSPNDKFEFRVRFTSTVAGFPPDVQAVTMVPLSNLPPESDIIVRTTPIPDAASTDYLVVTENQNGGQELFNGTMRTTYNVRITGKIVVFDASSPLYGSLFTRFHGRPDLKRVSIEAETLVIRSPVKLPGTEISVYARELRFEDTAGQASLDTTPIGYLTGAPQFQNGLHGQNGGDIVLRVQRIQAGAGGQRLISKGGNGQDAGQGRPGSPPPPARGSLTAGDAGLYLARRALASSHFHGLIDDTRFYGGLLNFQELHAVMSTGGGPKAAYSFNFESIMALDRSSQYDKYGFETGGMMYAFNNLPNTSRGRFSGSFDGISAHIRAYLHSGVHVDSFTITSWINPSGLGEEGTILDAWTSWHDDGLPWGRLYITQEGRIGFSMDTEDGVVAEVLSPESVRVNEWTFVSVVRNSQGTMFLYLDGSLVASRTGRRSSRGNAPFVILGARYNGMPTLERPSFLRGFSHFDGPVLKGPTCAYRVGDLATETIPVVFVEVMEWKQSPEPPSARPHSFFTFGSRSWPADGQDATPPGIPGNAGSGGVIRVSAGLGQTLSLQSGGIAGKPGALQLGGEPQKPVKSVWLRGYPGHDGPPLNWTGPPKQFWTYCIVGEHTAQKGRDGLPISAALPVGADGRFAPLTGPDARWLAPNFLWMVIAHAKDAYRNGNIPFARGVFQDYLAQLDQYGTPPAEFAVQFEQARMEMQQLLHRIESNLDYFGNPAGWVPLLSLEANMRAFTNEVDAAIPLLYVSRWLRLMADQNIKDVAALQDAMNKLSSDNLQAASEVNEALAVVPALQFQAAEIDVQLQQLQADLQRRTEELLARARDNVEDRNRVPFWQKAAGVIGTIAKVFPVTNPVLGPLSQGIDFLAKFSFDVSNPLASLESLKNVPDITSLFKASTFDTTFRDAEEAVKGFVDDFRENVNLRSPGSALNTAKYLQASYVKHRTVIDQIMQSVQDKAVPQNEIEAELARLEREDGAYQDLIRRLRDLNARKKALVDTLEQTLQTISSQTSKIDQNLLSIAAMYQSLSSTTAQFDHNLAVYVRDMEQRAKERLLRYQYYMAKAYEYRMLKAYPGDFNIDKVVDGILALFAGKSTYPGNVDLSGIKEVYTESVRQIVATALNELQTKPPERSLPFLFELSPAELQQLDQTGVLSLDLSPRIAGLPSEDNRHIADIAIAGMEVTVRGPIGTFGRVRVIIDHQGQSTGTSNGRTYQFQFGANQQKDAPFTWGASYDVLSKSLSQEKPSTAGIALVQSLLKITGPVDPALLFARPGADAVVKLSKVQDPATMNAQITKLRLAVTVDFFRTASHLVKLKVQTTGGALPYVAVDRADFSNRSDGLGTFQRTYNLGDRVTLTASPYYAGLKFLHWVDEAGNILGSSPTLVVSMNAALVVRPVYAEYTPLVTGDFDGNGTPDLVWQSENTRQVGVWYTGGTPGNPAFAGKLIAGPQPGWSIVGVADLNSDGHPDLIWQHDATRAPGVWYMGGSDGSVLISGKMLAGPQPGWRIVGAADLDRDGHPDLIWQEDTTRAPGVWYMGGSDGGTLLGGRMLAGPQPGWSIVSTADLNLDGHPDLIWQEDSTRAIGVWYMGGNDGGTFLGGRMLSGSQRGWRVVGSADLNLDGHPDLIWQQDTTGAPGVWYMGGSDGGNFLDGRMLSGPQPGWRIVAPK